MPEHTSCRTYRFWSLVRRGAIIGRCRNAALSGAEFPMGSYCCSLWGLDRRTNKRDHAPGHGPGPKSAKKPRSR
jgi:hypothetical protein